MDSRVCRAMWKVCCKLKTKPKTITEFKEALQVVWGNLPIDNAVKDLSN